MIIKRITLKNFGSVQYYDAVLTSELNILDTFFTLEISQAIGLVLCSKTVIRCHGVDAYDDALVTSEVFMGGSSYYIELKPIGGGEMKLKASDDKGNDVTEIYLYAMSHSWEQDEAESFDGRDKSYPLRLRRYIDFDDCEAANDLHSGSDHIVSTKTFRSHLAKYIKTFEPEPINNVKNYKVKINNLGQFETERPGISGEIPLSETEEKLFLYICFLNVAEFWEDVEKMRDMHHEKKPLMIQNFIEFLDQTTDIHALISRTVNLKRQVILLTLPMDKQTKKKWIGGDAE